VICQVITFVKIPHKFFDMSSKIMIIAYTVLFLVKGVSGFLSL
jgi:hypothetical protein